VVLDLMGGFGDLYPTEETIREDQEQGGGQERTAEFSGIMRVSVVSKRRQVVTRRGSGADARQFPGWVSGPRRFR
jgi:hypothetical protein